MEELHGYPTSGVGTIFGQGGKIEFAKIGNAKQRSTLELESLFVSKTSVFPKKKVLAGFGAFFDPKASVLQKKRSSLDFGAFSCPKHGSRHRSQGRAKVAQEGQLPPLPLTSRAYVSNSRAKSQGLDQRSKM